MYMCVCMCEGVFYLGKQTIVFLSILFAYVYDYNIYVHNLLRFLGEVQFIYLFFLCVRIQFYINLLALFLR